MKRVLLAAIAVLASLSALAQDSFVIPPDYSGKYASYVRRAPARIDARVLAANTAESHTVPAGFKWVLFSSTCNFYAKPAGTAAVPAADVTDGTGSELNPAAWYIPGLTSIGLISPTTCVITMAFYT